AASTALRENGEFPRRHRVRFHSLFHLRFGLTQTTGWDRCQSALAIGIETIRGQGGSCVTRTNLRPFSGSAISSGPIATRIGNPRKLNALIEQAYLSWGAQRGPKRPYFGLRRARLWLDDMHAPRSMICTPLAWMILLRQPRFLPVYRAPAYSASP